MASYEKPNESLPEFNNIVFTDANTTTLSLAKAKSLFLGRTGTPNSTATATTFSGTINGLTLAVNSSGTRIGTGAGLGNTGASMLMVGDGLLGGGTPSFTNNNVMVGENMGTGSDLIYNTFVGMNIYKTGAGYPIGNTIMGYNTSNKLGGNYSTALGYASAFNNLVGGDNNVSVGYNSLYNNTTGTKNVAVGYNAFNTGTIYNNSTALGASTVVAGNQAVAIGYLATASDNQIVLGTANETVICKGTALAISLSAASNLSVNGMTFGTGVNSAVNGNIFIGQLVGTNGNGTTNTVVGHNAFTSAINTSSTGNTFIGSNAGKDITATVNTCTIVGQGSYTSTATPYNNASCLGYNCQIGGANSTAIGVNATTTLANQIVLGTATECVYCVGIPTTGSTPYTSLVLSSGIQLQTAYPAVPSSTMLGYRLSNSASPFAVAGSSIISGTVVNFAPVGGIVLTAGTWSINFTLELLVATAITTATAQTIYISTASAGAYSTRVPACGSTRIHTTYTYAIGDTPAFSGSFSYYTASGASLYPVFILTFTGGSFSGTGYYTATRIA